MSLKVSVIIPVYNEENYLDGCLSSLFRQTEKPDEVIIVDNNSTDNTLKIASRYPVRLLHEKKQGMTYARNTGFNSARYPILARIDADTRVSRNWIVQLKKNFEDPSIIGVSGTFAFYDAPREIKKISEKIINAAFFDGTRRMLKHNTFFGSNMALRSSVWEKIRDEICHNDNLVHEDIDLAIHSALHGTIAYDPKLKVSISFRSMKRSLPDIVNRLIKWPQSKLVHTKYGIVIRKMREADF